MKYFKLFLLGLFIFSFFFVVGEKINAQTTSFAPYRPLCLGIQGKFYANKTWKGGYIEVGCAGDDGGAAPSPSQACTGEVQRVRPGETFRLTKCSCFDKEGCLKIGKDLTLSTTLNANRRYTVTVDRYIKDMPAFINNGCTINKIGKMCGSNGQIIKPTIKITCDVPQTSTPTPTGGICPVPGKVTNVRISCPNCEPSGSTNSTVPTSTPTPTTVSPTTSAVTLTPTVTLSPTPGVVSGN